MIISIISALLPIASSDQSFANTEKITVEVLGVKTFPTGFQYDNTEVGGLSGITYDRQADIYYAISDDRSTKAPSRFYQLKIDVKSLENQQLNTTNLATPAIEFQKVHSLLDKNRQPYPPSTIDPEGIAFNQTTQTLLISSEGDTTQKIQPAIQEFTNRGEHLKDLTLNDKFLIRENSGVRNNLSLESSTISPNNHYLFTANENALIQDGNIATLKQGSLCRIVQYDLLTYQPTQEFLYLTYPIIGQAINSQINLNTDTNGITDLLAINDHELIVLERSFALNTGNVIQLFLVNLTGAETIKNIPSLKSYAGIIQPLEKKLLWQMQKFNNGTNDGTNDGINDLIIDNIEGITFGPKFSDGSQSLILVSDNNFQSVQSTQFWILKVKGLV
ncbi:MAG: esterase-like activity of phytase family protein [Microcoleaceae cyanobacterium]